MKLKALHAMALLAIAFVGCAIVETGDHVWFKEGATSHEQDAALAAARVQFSAAPLLNGFASYFPTDTY